METYPRNLKEFDLQFRSDEACREYLLQLRWPDGFRCPRCGCRESLPVRTVLLRCRDCRHQTSVTARHAAQRAVELDAALSDGRLSLAHFQMQMWHWKDSEMEFKRAIALNPSNATAHRWYAVYLSSLARHQEALAEIAQAHRLDPLSSITNAEIVRALYYGRQYEHAMDEARKAELLDPEFPRTHFWLGRVYAQMGKYPEAIAEAERAGPSLDSTLKVTEMAYARARAGKSAEARALLKELQERSKGGYVPAYDFAIIHLALGESETAFQWLQKAYDRHDWGLFVIAVESRLDPLRSDPRFAELLRKVGLPQ